MATAVVLLSVGGKLYSTTLATLTSPLAHDSMLEKLVSLHMEAQDGSMQATCTDPRYPGALFIDRDGENFSYILNYLRDGPEAVLPADLHTTQLVLREARYYQLTGLIRELTRMIEQLYEKAKCKELRVAEEAEKWDKQRGVMDDIFGNLKTLRDYLAPKHVYHINNRPRRQLLDDLKAIKP